MDDPAPATSEKEAHFRAGLEHFAHGDLDAALVRLEAALAIDSGYVDALRTIAMTWYRKGDFARALEFGRRHLEADPKDVMAHSSLSLFLMKNGRVKEAEDVAAKAKVLTWKKQLREGPDARQLNVLDPNPPPAESPPIMPLMPPPRPADPKPKA